MIRMNQWGKLGLKGKTIAGLGALLLIALLVMGGTIYFQAMNLAVYESLESTGKNIETDAMALEAFLEGVKGDLMVMASTPPIHGIIRARDNSGIDPLTGDKTEYWYARMAQIFGAFLKYHPEYYQLRYLDEHGKEIVRADLIGKTVAITPRNELQNKAQYTYFTETMKLREDEVYYSPVNLNREYGAIQIPHTPVFRVATPVYDAQKRARGAVVINVFADAMFSIISAPNPAMKKYIINQDGYFLLHPDKTWAFGFDLSNAGSMRGYTIKDSMPEFSDEMKASDSQVKYHKQMGHVDAFKKIHYDAMNKNRYWAVIHEIPESLALNDIQIAGNTMLVVGLFITVGSLVVITWFTSRRLVTPILTLSEAVSRIGHGDFTARAPEDGRKDELGELAMSVNWMAGIIEKNLNELTILNSVTIAASSSLSVHSMANNALDAILQLQLLKFQNKGGIFIADKKSRTLKLAASRGFSKEQEVLDAVVPFGDCLCGIAAETGKAILTERCCDNPQHTRKYAGITPHGHLILPLKSGGEVLGILVLYLSADTKIDAEETRLYRSIADILAVSLQNALHFANINELQSRHGLILNSLGEGIYGLDTEGICTFMNPTAERMLGYEAAELIGARLHPITHHTRPDGSAYPREECRIYASFRDNAVYHVDDEVFWKKDGSSFLVEYTSTPILDENGDRKSVV